jgi:hypothetical protein
MQQYTQDTWVGQEALLLILHDVLAASGASSALYFAMSLQQHTQEG